MNVKPGFLTAKYEMSDEMSYVFFDGINKAPISEQDLSQFQAHSAIQHNLRPPVK